jgi:hypothetical protein
VRRRGVRGSGRLCGAAEAGLNMLVMLIYGAAAIGVAVLMVVALVRPERF